MSSGRTIWISDTGSRSLASGNGWVVKEKNTTCSEYEKGEFTSVFSHTTIKLENKGIWSAKQQWKSHRNITCTDRADGNELLRYGCGRYDHNRSDDGVLAAGPKGGVNARVYYQ